jgi:hypothetical protein
MGALALVWSGCEGKKQTEYVAGVSTQVQVPRDLKTIRVDLSVGGIVQFCRAYSVYDGKVQLPRSLGSFKTEGSSGTDPITLTVSGFTDEFSETSPNNQISACLDNPAKVTPNGSRILRRSRQPYIPDRILFLPMPLKFACWDKDCGEDKTCKGGTCVDAATDASKLPDWRDDLIDGTGGACFKAKDCLAVAEPPAIVNADDCTYALPNTPSAPPQVSGAPPNPIGPPPGVPWDGLNVELTFDGGANTEILDKDPDEGFIVPDPNKPQQFRLAPGLCDMVKGIDASGNATTHRITSVRASGTCRPKSIFEPICSDQQLAIVGADPTGVSPTATVKETCTPTELKPPSAVLMVVADQTVDSANFYAQFAGGLASVSLADPAFEKTDIGLQLFPGPPLCQSNAFTPEVPPESARKAKADVGAKFKAAVTPGPLRPSTPVDLDGALRDTYAVLADAKYANYYRRAVVLIGNHGFDAATCDSGAPPKKPEERAGTAHTTNKIDTYVVELTAASTPGVTGTSGGAIAAAGGKAEYDARGPGGGPTGQRAIRDIVNDLATCVYDTGKPVAQDMSKKLSYTDPLTGLSTVLSSNAACTSAAAAADGWGNDPTTPGRVLVCGASCTNYRAVLSNAAAYANQNGQPALAVPMFVHTEACAPKK